LAQPPSDEKLSPQAREALALYKIESQKENTPSIDEDGPDELWQYIPSILGLPVEYNDTPLARKPWITWGLSAAMAVLFITLWTTDSFRGAIDAFGFIPEQWYRHECMTLLSSFLLHAGILHVVANLYFFMVFGDNVEDHLGRNKFLLLLLACHMAGLLVHAAADPRSNIPLVGASGGIAGLLAYYALTFPHAKLGFFTRYWSYVRWSRISAIWALVLFVGLQLLGARQQHLELTNISSFAHLGGLCIGLIAGLWGRITSKEPQNDSQSVGPAN